MKVAYTILLALFVMFQAVCVQAQDPSIQGTVFAKKTYTDSEGKGLVILSHTGVYTTRPNKDDPEYILGNADLYAYGYRNNVVQWRMHDFLHECETSTRVEFSKDSPRITDLDGNGRAEVWLTYYIGCHGDVSPDTMKILMYEGSKKYALRGETFVRVDGMDLGGKYKADSAFAKAPAVFRQFADKLWQQNMRQ